MKTNTIYKALDKSTDTMSYFLVTENGVAVGEWDTNLSDATFAQVLRSKADKLVYSDITQLHARAVNKKLIVQW